MNEHAAREADRFGRTLSASEFATAAEPAVASIARPGPATDASPEMAGQGIGRLLAEQGLPSVGPIGPRFVVESLLGVGANGQVYAVVDQNLDRPLAAKVLSEDHPQRDAIEHFIDEARITASLQHPNVLPVYELDLSVRGQLYFTMKRIDGASLGDAVNGSTAAAMAKPIARINDVVAIFISVAQALSYAHHRGIIHQDIKPDNIMLGDFGEVLLVDWGSAVRVDDPHPKLYGTPLYMSPEQARLEHADARSDIYALGATLFHALTLRCPTWSDDADRFWQRKRAGEIDAPTAAERQRLPPALVAIALKALAADPSARYQTAADFRQDLQLYQAGLAVSALRDSWFARCRRSYRHNARRVWFSAAIMAVIATLALLLYGERLKEAATWGAPLVDEHFSGTDWQDRWQTKEGVWTVADGHLTTASDANTLLFNRRLSGDIAIDYVAERSGRSLPGDISLRWIPDSADTTGTIDNSYFCQIGARDNALAGIQHEGMWVAYSDFRARPGVRHRIRLEIVGDQMAMSVDGHQICRTITQLPFTGGRIALYGFNPGQSYHRVRIYTRHVAQKLPATAIGDALIRYGRYPEAIAEYQHIVESHPGTTLAHQASLREGLCRYRTGDHPAAFAVWRTLRGTDLDELARLHDLDRLNESGDYAQLTADMGALYRSASNDTRTRVALLWTTFVQDRLRQRLTARSVRELTDLVRLRDQVFPQEEATNFLTPKALITLDRTQEAVDRFAYQPLIAAEAWVAEGRADEVLNRYPWLSSLRFKCLLATGRSQEIDPAWEYESVEGTILRGEADALFASGNQRGSVCNASGHFEEVIGNRGAPPDQRIRALLFAGRIAECTEPERADIDVMMAEKRTQEALDSWGCDRSYAMWPRHLLGLEAWIAGDRARADQLFAVPPAARFHQLDFHLAHWVIVPALHELSGDRGALAVASADAMERRFCYEQKPWYNARYLTRAIDDAAYLAQPHRQFAAADLLLLKGVLAEISGEPAAASPHYRAWQALPAFRRATDLDPVLERFVAWRVAGIGAR
ncbi:MAG: protein kinase [Planctomycetes bacterium]|nr:protein kinase [Planctomycetota bacterium]